MRIAIGRQGKDGPRCCRCVVSNAPSLLSMYYVKGVAEIGLEGRYVPYTSSSVRSEVMPKS